MSDANIVNPYAPNANRYRRWRNPMMNDVQTSRVKRRVFDESDRMRVADMKTRLRMMRNRSMLIQKEPKEEKDETQMPPLRNVNDVNVARAVVRLEQENKALIADMKQMKNDLSKMWMGIQKVITSGNYVAICKLSDVDCIVDVSFGTPFSSGYLKLSIMGVANNSCRIIKYEQTDDVSGSFLLLCKGEYKGSAYLFLKPVSEVSQVKFCFSGMTNIGLIYDIPESDVLNQEVISTDTTQFCTNTYR